MHFLIFSLPGGESLAWSGGDAASRLIVAILGKHIRRDNPSAILVAGRAYHHGLLADEELHHHNPMGQGLFQDNPSHNPSVLVPKWYLDRFLGGFLETAAPGTQES